MPYEFVRGNGQEDRPVSPEFWRFGVKKIHQIPYNEVFYASHMSILHNETTGDIGVDTADLIRGISYGSDKPVPIMKVAAMDGDESLEGYLVDARRKDYLLNYKDLNFAEPDERMVNNKTTEALGVIFADPEGKIYFNSRHFKILLPYVESFLEKVDSEAADPPVSPERVPGSLWPVFQRPGQL